MKNISKEEIKKIIEDHQHYLNKDCAGWEGMRADFSNVDLNHACFDEANLFGALFRASNLRSASFIGANLSSAIFSCADAHEADFSYANLSSAIFSCADLSWADLVNANLNHTNLFGSDLSRANLNDADLSTSCLDSACLYHAHLYNTNFMDADIKNVDFTGAFIEKAKNIPFIPMACPEEGSFIGFKKAGGYIIKLSIPEDAKRSSALGRKCRCDKAIVLEIQNIDGTKVDIDSVSSNYDPDFVYTVGEKVSADAFDENRWHMCAPGIHFFINRQEAVDYYN